MPVQGGTLARMNRAFACSAAALVALTACVRNPEGIPDHTLVADEEGAWSQDGPLRFAVVANLRPPVPLLDRGRKLSHHEGATEALLTELRRRADKRELQFIAVLGDSVRFSADKEWVGFDTRFKELFDGQTVPNSEGYRVPIMPVAGDHEYLGDRDLKGLDGAFPGIGADIGFNRVASWYHFDVRAQGRIWRFVVTDSNKEKMGSRWNEQGYWIPRAAEGRYDHILMFMHHPVVTLGRDTPDNRDGAPLELVDALEDTVGLMRLRAVITGDAFTNEVILPGGRLGTAHFSAGGGGAGAEALERWGNARDQGLGDVQLEPLLDLKLQKDFARRAERELFPEPVVDMASGSGSWEGFTAAYDADYFPLYGYWEMVVAGDTLAATLHVLNPEGGFTELYRIDYEADRGWTSGI